MSVYSRWNRMLAGKPLRICSICLLSLTILGVSSPCIGSVESGDTNERNPKPSIWIHAKDPLDLGKQYVREKRYELAIEVYTNALQKSTSKFDLYIGRSRAYIGLHRYNEALADAELAIKYNPNHPLGYSARGFAYGHMDKLEESIADFTKAIEISPSTSQFYALRGEANIDLGRPQKAVDDLSLAIQIGKGKVNPIVFQHRGLAFRQLGRYEEALRDFSESLRKDPSLAKSRLHRSSVYRCLEQYDLAKLDLDEVIRKNPDNLEAHLQRAFVSIDQSDFESAAEDLVYADRKGMKDPYLFLSLAYTHYRLGNISEAINFNEKATLLFPGKLQSAATLQKGIFYLALGKLEVASEILLEGRKLAEQKGDIESVKDALDELDRIQAQNIVAKSVIEQNRDGLKETVDQLSASIGSIKGICHKRAIENGPPMELRAVTPLVKKMEIQ